MISKPFRNESNDTSDELLPEICSPEADAIWWYDCINKQFKSWTILDVGTGWNTWAGIPFWVNIRDKDGCTWRTGGALDTAISYTLCPGLNMISVPLFSTNLEQASDLMADIPNCTAVYRWKKILSCLNSPGFHAFTTLSDPAEDFSVWPGYSYWVNVTASGVWNPPNP